MWWVPSGSLLTLPCLAFCPVPLPSRFQGLRPGSAELGSGRHQVSVTATQLCHSSVRSTHDNRYEPVCVQMQLYSQNQGAGAGQIGPVVCGLPKSALATAGIGAGAQERGEDVSAACSDPSAGVTESRLLQLSFLGLEACSSPRPAGLDEINVPCAYWVASLCPVSLLPNPAHPFASPYSLLSSNGSIWVWCQFASGSRLPGTEAFPGIQDIRG